MGRTLVSIDRDSREPVYQQLRKALEHAIATGALDPNRALPSSRELARELGISRNTANTAYQELLAEGFIESRPRRGVFVNPEMVPHMQRQEGGAHGGRDVEWSRHFRGRPDARMPEIAKVTDWHTYPYPFVAGQVDPASFPRLAWTRALRDALEPPHVHYSLRDGIDEDDPMLLEALCREVLPTRGIEVEPDHVLVTLGSQQGLDLLAYTLVTDGDSIGVEDPGYPDARHIFVRAGARIVPYPVDTSGLIPQSSMDDLAMLHVTPSHHSPTNVTLSIGRRKQLLSMADRAELLLVEDDYDSEFRYQGSPTPALKALPGSDRVVYLGTFSKFLAPGLRLGYLVADPELIRELRGQRRYRVRHPSGHTQRAMALFIDGGQYQRTVRRRRTQLQRKWRALREALQEHLPWQVAPPPGGVSIWVDGPAELDGVRLAERALRRGVVIERGDVFFAEPGQHRHHIRLGFAAIGEQSIAPGVARLGETVREVLG
ncbi:PLP-dependent aminotransferase family protein [Haloechinothrix sp. LS1_15]|uniref:MocR-like pyridoxine biosynthesis transcription factor PdxR n=1 Tax=Haloechinothrix sp. LS1_15 TaxID=2652248 RepID=UPI0029480876|nr:PLP-dependent aminotransferase family protein [Haloechinothrix sp. LS1_15]MDV6014693.1 PLP-dependent aminotransferase family protein [Haloechinothrix sp. LS1_15]